MAALRILTGALALALIGPLGSVTARADELLSHEPAAPKVSAAEDALAWSTFDPVVGAWFLVVRRAGVTARLPVAPREVPFDVDLGTDGHGRLVAAYSRCDRESASFPSTGRGCDAYVYDLDRGGPERVLEQISRPEASEFMPSLSDGRVAFARVYERRQGAEGVRVRLHVRRLSGGRTGTLPGGAANDDPRTGPTALDLQGGRLALSWEAPGAVGDRFPYGVSELRVDDLAGGATLVERRARGELTAASVMSPTLTGDQVRYGTDVASEGSLRINDLRSFDLLTGVRGAARLPATLTGTAPLGSTVAAVRCAPGDTEPATATGCDVALLDGVVLADPDPLVAHVARPTTISAWQGWVAFSAYDGAGAYRLALRAPDGIVAFPRIRRRGVPFDVDLGPGPGSRLTAVYSRCTREPRTDPVDGLPVPATGRGCDVYRLGVNAGVETRVPVPGGRRRSEFAPAVWGSLIAFAQRDQGKGARSATILRLQRLDGRGPVRRIRVDGAPRAVDLNGTTIAEARQDTGRDRSLLILRRAGRPPRVLAAVDGSGRLLSPALHGDRVWWIARRLRHASTLVRYHRGTGARDVSVLPGPVDTLASTRGRTGTLIVYGHAEPGGFGLREPVTLPQALP